jgi:hypothetical protein
MLKLIYRTSQFVILHDAMISKFLTEDAWQRGIVPMRWLSNIEIDIRADFYEQDDRRDKMRERFAPIPARVSQ